MSDDQKKQLEQQLWNIANTLRGKMNADEFRDYILGFIFYKYLSEKMNIYANNILKPDGIVFTSIKENTENGQEYIEAIKEEAVVKLGYFLKPNELFSQIAKRGNSDVEGVSNFILEDLQKILTNIQLSTMGTESEEDFDNLFEDMDLNSTKLGKSPEARNEIIAKVLLHLDKIDFKLENTEIDVLGDAYEYLIGQFASGAGKKAGEFYTPQEVSKVLAKLVTTGKTKLKSVYDPTCGSGSLLLRVAKEVESVANFYGQELNRTTYNLARMNMILHDIHYRKFDIKQEDTLEHPQHIDERFEAIVANPPFSADWTANPLFTSDDRFSQYGRLAPKSKADYAFVQHMIHHLAENGTMAIVLPHGVLYRGNAELSIRQYLIEDRNYLDAVISLPANLFYGTAIPTCILIFKKCRENPDSILFIDASDDYDKAVKQNILRDKDIEKIISTFQNRTEIKKYSRNISLKEISENQFNLNFPRYIDKFKRNANIDLSYISDFLSQINNQSIEIEKQIDVFCNELNIPTPIGNNMELLSLFREGVMQKIFNKSICFKKQNGDKFQNWKKTYLGDIFSYHSTNSFSREKLNYENGNVKNIHYGDIHTKFHSHFNIEKENVPFVNPIINLDKISEEKYCKVGDIIIADASEDYADIGKCIEIINIDNQKVIAGLHTILARPDKTQVELGFLGFLMKSDTVKYQIMRFAQGTKVLGISSKRISEIEVELPSNEEQKKIVSFLTAIDNKINFNNSHIEAIEEYRKSLII
ncbi:Type I restriction modification DNA specificity domain-containing protein [Polaribacter sp. Hel1_33_78]|nr:Type I restriction modification DNA specificity domain-containing protein [Polaribacter sp. Hel1_33_78]